jgi:hypothetical protein
VVKYDSGAFPPLSSTFVIGPGLRDGDRIGNEPRFTFPLINASVAGANYPRTWWLRPLS